MRRRLRNKYEQGKLAAKTAYALRRLLTARDVFGSEDTASGRLNPRRLTRAMGGAEIVFTRRTHTPAIRTALTVLVDLSGSMSGSNINNVATFLSAVGPTLDRSPGCVWQVIGFTSGYSAAVSQSVQGAGIDSGSAAANGIPQEWAQLTRFKTFRDTYSRIAGRLERTLISSVSGGTPDYPAIYQCVRELLARPEERRVLMVLTDGRGDVNAVKETCLWAQTKGVEVLGIGIGSGIVESVYPHHASAPYADVLLETSLPALIDTLIKARLRKEG